MPSLSYTALLNSLVGFKVFKFKLTTGELPQHLLHPIKIVFNMSKNKT